MTRVIIQPESSENVRNLIKIAVENQLRIINLGITKTMKKLHEIEKETGMKSSVFYEEFQKGNLGDEIRFIKWAGEHETLERLQRDYNDLKEIELCS